MTTEAYEKISDFLIDNSKELFGHQFVIPSEYSGSRQRKFFRMELEQEFGVFGMVIASAHVDVAYEAMNNVDDGDVENPTCQYWVNIGLSYEHPSGGRNGSNIATVWLDKDFRLVDMRKAGDGR